MNRLFLFLVAVLLLAIVADAAARSWVTIGLFVRSTETKTTGQEFAPNSNSTGNIGGAGHQIANLPNIGQGIGTTAPGGELVGEDGLPINLAGFQTQYSSTATNTASLEAALEYLRADQSDVTRAGQDASMSDTGDKPKTGPSINAAITGQGTSTLAVDKAALEEFQAQAIANKAALDAALAELASIKAVQDGGTAPGD